MSKTLLFTRREYSKNLWQTTQTTVTYPDDCKVHFDVNQHTLRLIRPDGEVVAAFTSIWWFKMPAVGVKTHDSDDEQS